MNILSFVRNYERQYPDFKSIVIFSEKLPIVSMKSVTPLPRQKTKEEKKHRDKSDLGENFIAPDGGWGWVVAIASGICVLVTLSIMQQFGILLRNRFKELGISSSQMTTIINTQQAVSASTGLFNGPLYRRFSYRQCGIAGAIFVFVGVFGTVFADSFAFYLVTIAILYGIGRGLVVTSSTLAVNTYFKNKRRTATSYQYTVAALGPISLPYISTFLLSEYGVFGSVLLFSGLSLHNLPCAMTFQPVQWHAKKPQIPVKEEKRSPSDIEMDLFLHQVARHETSMMGGAHDSWVGSKYALETMSRSHILSLTTSSLNLKSESELVSNQISTEESTNEEDEPPKELSIFERISILFDLDLLKDLTFVNIAVGLTIISFCENNFSILTPFILSDFEFDESQIAAAMSLMGICDLAIRFLIPSITERIKLENKAFLLIGVVGMIFGRVVVAHCRNFVAVLIAFGWMGMSKAMRIVFCNLIIPGYIPLKRLPEAYGLQLILSGIFTMAFGPIIGIVTDATDYSVTLHWFNILCFFVVVTWLLEDYCRQNPSQEEL